MLAVLGLIAFFFWMIYILICAGVDPLLLFCIALAIAVAAILYGAYLDEKEKALSGKKTPTKSDDYWADVMMTAGAFKAFDDLTKPKGK